VMAGEGLSQVRMLLGHRRHRTTANYAHLADAHPVEAAGRSDLLGFLILAIGNRYVTMDLIGTTFSPVLGAPHTVAPQTEDLS